MVSLLLTEEEIMNSAQSICIAVESLPYQRERQKVIYDCLSEYQRKVASAIYKAHARNGEDMTECTVCKVIFAEMLCWLAVVLQIAF